jgi:hypothetical protein
VPWLAALALLLTCLGPATALAQEDDEDGPEVDVPEIVPSRSLLEHFGRRAVEHAYRFEKLNRLESLERLARLADPRSLDLIRELVNGETPEENAKARLVVARGLAPRAQEPEVTRLLLELATTSTTRASEQPLPLAELARDTATLALTKYGDKRAASALALLARREGPIADSIRRAFEAYPMPGVRLPRARARGKALPQGAAASSKSSSFPDRARDLALSKDESAVQELERALSDAKKRAWALRALVVRANLEGDASSTLESALETALSSNDPTLRAVGAWGLATLDPERGAELVASSKPEIVAAAARAAFSSEVSTAAALRLVETRDPGLSTALALSLIDRQARDTVPTSRLLELARAGGSATPLAVLALSSRADPELESDIAGFLRSQDPRLRAHTALGLGLHPNPEKLSVLASAYAFEADASVRRAIVTALGERHEPIRRRTLELARDLDPDASVRKRAATALSGGAMREFSLGRRSAWVELTNTPKSARPDLVRSAMLDVELLSLPVVSDPDGAIVLTSLPEGGFRLRLAPGSSPGDASRGSGKAHSGPRPSPSSP